MTLRVSRSQVLAFRLQAHGLTERSAGEGLVEAAGRCGIQNSPPGSALLAVHARVRDVTVAQMGEAVADEKSLLQSWCMRGAPFFFPTVDAPVFTTGALPPTEEALRHLLPGVVPSLDRLGLGLTEAADLCRAHLTEVLSGRRLAVNELGAELAARIAPGLPKAQRDVWDEEGPYAPGQPLGEGVVHFCLRVLTLQGVVCFAPREGNRAPFVLVREWLGRPIPDVDPEVARAELLRRYLRCYGPSTRADFAGWVGVRAPDTDAWWGLVGDELARVEYGGQAWLLGDDLDSLRSAPGPIGVRLLPLRDPYTQQRDHSTIVDSAHHREVWRTVGEPGTLLVDGAVSGTWRARKSGRRLTLTVTPFDPLAARDQARLRDEAEQIAPLRGATTVELVVET